MTYQEAMELIEKFEAVIKEARSIHYYQGFISSALASMLSKPTIENAEAEILSLQNQIKDHETKD